MQAVSGSACRTCGAGASGVLAFSSRHPATWGAPRTPIGAVPASAVEARPVSQHRLSSRTAQGMMGSRVHAQSQQATVLAQNAGKKVGVLFVCLGNICRSPTAEAMFRAVVEREGLAGAFDIDSCGTGGGARDWYKPGGYSYHEGDAADERMTVAARRRGVFLTSRSRPLKPEDLARWDYIIGMDDANRAAILKASEYWVNNHRTNGSQALPDLQQVRAKTSLMTEYCTKHSGATHVPDPYYGGPAGFEKVLDLLDDACSGLLTYIQQQQQATTP